MKYKRIFVCVIDSVGIGGAKDAAKFGDDGSNTLKHIEDKAGPYTLKNMTALGLGDLRDFSSIKKVNHPHSFCARLNEKSAGKDTMTGHWEMMGIRTTKGFKTFTDTGFPKELLDELEKKTGHKIVGNVSASGTEIIKKWGEHQLKTGDLIVYTSADPVLQIAAHKDVIPLEDLYKYCKIARKICDKPKYLVGRIIARPYVGADKNSFTRVGKERHDYAVPPSEKTILDICKSNKIETVSIGKINDIFSGKGISRAIHIDNNIDGMHKVLAEVKNEKFKKGLCFINLVEFDSEFGHRRDPKGYKNCLEEYDVELGKVLKNLREDDLFIITADHGNDPTWKGTDHTREQVPFLAYSQKITSGKYLDERKAFADIGASVLFNFNLKNRKTLIGEPIEELFNK